MSLVAIVVALLAQHAFPEGPRHHLSSFYGRMVLSASKRLNAGDTNSGVIGWIALMCGVLVPAALIVWIAAALHPFLVWLLNVVVLYATLRFLNTAHMVGEIEKALRGNNPIAAANLLAQWQAEPVETDDPGAIARLTAEHALREAHQGTFGPLFWFLVMPGPLGLIFYPLALRAAQGWAHLVNREEHDFGWFAARAFQVIDWIPQRATAFTFAVVGNFEDALYCWRSQAAAWVRPEEGVVLASGAGALGVRLGDPIPVGPSFAERPSLGTGEAAREDALASLEGLLWRALIVWLIVYLLAAALRLG